ncbi:MAG: Smr/MutS family protein [Pseudomonadota bacterium]
MGRRGKPRSLSPEDQALWQKVAATAIPLHRHEARHEIENMPEGLSETTAKPLPDPRTIRPQPRTTGPTTGFTLAPPVEISHSVADPDMDRKRFDTLRRGKLAPQARIDLHGMTADRAHRALISFVLRARSDGLRLILVITGKGKRRDPDAIIPERQGVLRHAVPEWLRQPPTGPMILQIATAHRKHGGEGAYYVYLRRQR